MHYEFLGIGSRINNLVENWKIIDDTFLCHLVKKYLATYCNIRVIIFNFNCSYPKETIQSDQSLRYSVIENYYN